MKKLILKMICLMAAVFVFLVNTGCSVGETEKVIVIQKTEYIEKTENVSSSGKKSGRSLYKEDGKVYFEVTNVYLPESDGTSFKLYKKVPVAFLADSEGKKINDMPYLEDKLIPAFSTERHDNYDIDGTIVHERTDGNLSKGAKMIIEPDKSTVTFSSFDRFFMYPEDSVDLDSVIQTSYINVYRSASSTRKGSDTKLCFSDYDIDIICDKGYEGDNVVFFPLRIINSLKATISKDLIYNGEELYFCNPPSLSSSPNNEALLKVISQSKFADKEKSEDLKNLVLNDMIFSMDTFYGLKDIHNITSFKSFYDLTGLTALLKGDAKDTVQAVFDLSLKHLDDGHSKPLSKYTPFLSTEADVTENPGQTRTLMFADLDKYLKVRKTVFGDEWGSADNPKTAYQEYTTNINGTDITTAYLTFDQFKNPTKNYRELVITNPPSDSANIDLYMNDTFGLVIYANAQIRRENSPVKNVVIDISVNGGGYIDGVVYIATWILNEIDSSGKLVCNAKICARNQMNGAESTVGYIADLNLDGLITSLDLLPEGIKVYVLAGSASFSAGNALPAIMKASKKVSIIGKRTFGGSCVVWSRTTADGAWFNTSGFRRLSVNVNGAFYDIDTGVEPDYPLDSIESFYDRDNLNRYLYKIQNPGL